MFTPSRDQVRRFFCDTWRKHRDRNILEGLEATALDIVLAHPEYHALLDAPEAAVETDYTPERGETNPFLHLSLHLAIAEQVSIDQPPGIRDAYARLAARRDPHDAQHVLLECLGETIWTAQRTGQGLDHLAYLECIRRKST